MYMFQRTEVYVWVTLKKNTYKSKVNVSHICSTPLVHWPQYHSCILNYPQLKLNRWDLISFRTQKHILKITQLSISPIRYNMVIAWIIIIGYCINTTLYDRGRVRACEVMRFRDMNEVIKCCIYTITLLLYTRIKLTGIMLIRDRNSFNYIYIRKMNPK